ncbi:MAG: hypothetical protein KDD64_08640 [Bdellovibrionales bacterium]|nr:hypothetical protein [Bdellovibrionales bacterium]
MPRKGSLGKYIFSAGEIGAFVVCPESWRLSNLELVKTKKQKARVEEGQKLHEEWAETYGESVFLSKHLRFTVSLLAFGVLYALLKQFLGK